MKARLGSPSRVAVAALVCAVLAGCGAGSGERHDTIRIGVLAECQTSGVTSYAQDLAGAELPLLGRGGRLRGASPSDGVVGVSIAGKPIELVLGCSGGSAGSSTTDSALAEARRLVEIEHVDVLVDGEDADSSSGNFLRDYARLRPGIAFVYASFLAPATTLSDPAPNLFDFGLNWEQWMAGLGTYAYRTLGWRRAVVIESAQFLSVSPWLEAAGFTAEFCTLGGTIVKRVAGPFPPGAGADLSQYGPMLAQIPRHGVDGFLMAGGSPTLLALAKGYPALRGSLARKVVGFTLEFDLTKLGPIARRLEGVVTSDPGGLVSTGAGWDRYAAELRQAFPNVPVAAVGFSFDFSRAVEAVLKALAAVHGDLSGGERRFMSALAKTHVQAAGIPVHLDAHRAAVGPNYLRKLEVDGHGNLVYGGTYKRIDNVEETFGGYFSSTSPLASATTPICHRAKPPPWTRSG
jgi:branched-chain amino acid transport system substrate-binding protein